MIGPYEVRKPLGGGQIFKIPWNVLINSSCAGRRCVVYKVDENWKRYAVKVEPTSRERADERLPLEAQVLKRLQFSRFSAHFIEFAECQSEFKCSFWCKNNSLLQFQREMSILMPSSTKFKMALQQKKRGKKRRSHQEEDEGPEQIPAVDEPKKVPCTKIRLGKVGDLNEME